MPQPSTTVVSVSETNRNIRTVRVKRPDGKSTYLPALAKGLGITLKHFVRNTIRNVPLVGGNSSIETLQYPEEKIDYPVRNRGLHRLMTRDDGSVRCVACMCCPTVCPANCITIIPAEADNEHVEKYPAVFEIDELRCIACGLCVEACPCDAIRMDTGMHATATETRADGIETLESMLARGTVAIATQGGKGKDWRSEEIDIPYQPREKELNEIRKKK